MFALNYSQANLAIVSEAIFTIYAAKLCFNLIWNIIKWVSADSGDYSRGKRWGEMGLLFDKSKTKL